MFAFRSVLVSFLLAFAGTVAGSGESFEECLGIFSETDHVFDCCESLNQKTSFDLNKCKHEKDQCAQSDCVLKRMHIQLTDGRIDDASAAAAVEQWLRDVPGARAMGERIKTFCLEGQYEDYAAEGATCESYKFALCSYVNSIVVCPKWKKSDACKQIEDSATECKKILDEIE